jgi:glutathione S-transferase
MLKGLFLCIFLAVEVFSLNWNSRFQSLFGGKQNSQIMSCIESSTLPGIGELQTMSRNTPTGNLLKEEEELRAVGEGTPHTDCKLRLFGTTEEPKVTFYRDTAAWCPYCQKVWILLEEKRIPYKVVKINMRSYGDKPQEFLRMVPNGLLPAIVVEGQPMTESLDIMLFLDKTFRGEQHPLQMFPDESNANYQHAISLMRLERDLFGRWCNLLFRPQGNRQRFEEGLNMVNRELEVTTGPWFLENLSIVDLTFITHIERMCASLAYWHGFKIRGDGKWPAIERWMSAFESLPSYMATKSDYYTHVMDIPPQYGTPFPVRNYEQIYANIIDGREGNSWKIPLPPFQPFQDVEPVEAAIDPGEETARHEAVFRLSKNIEAVAKFALRGAGSPGKKRFQVCHL